MNKNLDILAKGKPEFTPLFDHLKHVELVAVKVAKYLGFDAETSRIGAILHDIGKCHPVFQKQLNGERPIKPFRHELSSLFFIGSFPESVKVPIIKMIVGHHKSIKNDSKGRGILDLLDNEPGIIDYHLKDWDKWMPKAIEILNALDLIIPPISRKQALETFYSVEEYCEEVYRNERGPSLWRGLLMSSDYFASAMIHETEQYVKGLFQIPDLSFFNRQHHLYPLSLVSSVSKKKHTIVVAPTGAGKTDYLLRRCGGRVFYTLPFQASINAMYKRLKSDLSGKNPDLDIRVLHGASSLIGKEDSDIDTSLQEMVGSAVKVLTPYQLAGIALGSKGYESIIVDLKGSDIVLDEVHTYSGSSQSLILKIISVLKSFDCKIHVGTATMPSILYNKIVDLLEEENVYEVKLPVTQLDDFDRHKVFKLDSWGNTDDIIKNAVESNSKLLIVCNRVDKAQEVYTKICVEYPDVDKLLIHSRFKRKDRNDKERLLIGLDSKGDSIQKFNTSLDTCIVVSTQVVEVSLDISFDLMITECAPLDSMTQRFGRINRKRTTETIGNYKPVYMIAPPLDKIEALPYDVDVLSKSFEILPNGGVLHERSIQEKIDKVFDRINFLKIEEVSAYGENGEWNIPLLTHHSNSLLMELLEIDSVVCITEDDIEAYENSKHDDRMQFEIPMRYYSVKNFPSLNLGKKPYVIPSSAYGVDIGLSMKLLKGNHVENQIL